MGRSVSAVVITYNSGAYLSRCLQSLREQSLAPGEVIVVDNRSTDGSAELAASALPGARILRNPENLGFSVAANQGIRMTAGEFVLLLNPDVYLTRTYLERILEAFERADHTCGSATGKLFRGIGPNIEPTSRIDTKGIRMTRGGRHLDIESEQEDFPAGETMREVFGVSGAAPVYRRSFLEDVEVEGEFFDESFFAYREDADLSWRGRLLGWRAIYVPEAVGYHVRTVTPAVRRQLPPSLNYHSVKNRFLLRLKNQGWYLMLRNLPFEVIRDVVVVAATLTIERSSLPALRWLWIHRREILRKRCVIQSRRRVSDRDLAQWFR